MSEPTKTQIIIFNTLLNKHNLMDEKVKIVQQLSNDRCSSTKLLTFDELQGWIDAMMKDEPKKEVNTVEQDKRQRQINAIIAMAREMGVITRHQVVGKAGLQWKSDYSGFNDWLLNKSCVKKASLNDVATADLPTLVSQYKAINLDYHKAKK